MIRNNASFSRTAQLWNSTTCAGLAAVIVLGLAGPALAQNRTGVPSAETTGRGSMPPPAVQPPMRAPVGHLQPSPRDTPGLANEDISRTQEQIEFDKSLRICRGC